MPTYTITDPSTGKTIKVRGDSPPTEQELTEIFAGMGGTDNAGPNPGQQAEASDQAPNPLAEPTHGEPTPGMPGFMKGLSGQSQVGMSLGDIADKGVGHALGDFFSAENAGSVVRDAGMMGAGLLIPGAMKGAGRGMEALGNATGKGPGSLAMRAMAGHTMGGPAGAVAAAAGPPVLRGFGRVMQRTGAALSNDPSSTAPPPLRGPTVVDLGNVPQYSDLGNVPRPSPGAPPSDLPLNGPRTLGRDPGFRQLGPAPTAESAPPPAQAPAPAAPQGRASAQTHMPEPSIDAARQTAMLSELEGPAPLGSLPPGQTPRVKAWKPGYGPSAGDAKVLRDAYGARTAGSLLKARGDQVESLAPRTGEATLPSQTSRSLGEQFLAADPQTRAQMIESAPNPLVRQLFESLNVRANASSGPRPGPGLP